MERNATHEHICNKCKEVVIAYRDCTGEGHLKCTEDIQGKIYCGQLKLTKQYSSEEAKNLDIKAVFS